MIERLESGGASIKEGLADQTGATAIKTLYDFVSNLAKVKRNLKDLVDDTNELDAKTALLKEGLTFSQQTLGEVLSECSDTSVCRDFLSQFDLATDLVLTDSYQNMQFR